jgi:hypothetical protein
MRSDKDFDTWFLLRLAEFVLRCQGVDFKWRNDPSVLDRNRYELVKNSRNNARAVNRWNARRLSILNGDRENPECWRASNVLKRTGTTRLERGK